jgi:hypothetical protein
MDAQPVGRFRGVNLPSAHVCFDFAAPGLFRRCAQFSEATTAIHNFWYDDFCIVYLVRHPRQN